VGDASAAPPPPNEEITANVPEDAPAAGSEEPTAPKRSELFEKATDVILQYKKTSLGFLIARLGIGEKRARKLQFELEDAGIISPPDERGYRTITERGNPDANTVEEAPDTIAAQQQALVEGKRRVVMYPDGTKPASPPKGSKRFKIEGQGVFDYNPAKITTEEIKAAVKAGTLNELLDLGPVNKEAVAESAAAGATPVAVVERTPGGTEVKAAAGTTETAPEQISALEATKAEPDNAVAVEDPRAVVDERAASGIRKIDPATLSAEERQRMGLPPLPEAAPTGPRVLEDESPEGKAKTAAAKAAADEITQKQIIAEAQRAKTEDEAAAQEARAEQVQANIQDGAYESIEAEAEARSSTGGSNWSGEEKTAITNAARIAKDTFDEAVPHIPEKVDASNLEQMKDFLRQTVALASSRFKDARTAAEKTNKKKKTTEKERGILSIRAKADYDTVTNHAVWVSEAKRLLNRIMRVSDKESTRKTLIDDLNVFLGNTEALKSGDGEPLRGKRREDNAVHERPEEMAEFDQDIASHQYEDVEEAGGRQFDNEADTSESKSVMADDEMAINSKVPPPPSDSTRVKADEPVEEGVDYNIGAKDQSKVTVETKKKRVLLRRESIGGEEHVAELDEADVTATVPLRDAFNKAALAKGNALTQLVMNRLVPRLREMVGDVPVKVVKQEVLDAMYPDRPAGRVDGYYDPLKDHIVVSDKYLKDGKFDRHLLAHEGVHAYLQHAVESSAALKADIQEILDHVRDVTDGADSIYGLKDVHEFLAEALTNADFQQHLMDTEVPPSLAAKFDMPGEKSMWNALVSKVRDYLGLDKSRRELDALSYVMRLVDRAEDVAARNPDTSILRSMRDKGLLRESAKVVDIAAELSKRGVPPEKAKALTDMISDQYKDGVTHYQLTQLAEAFKDPLKAKTAPDHSTYLKDKNVPKDIIDKVTDFLGSDEGKEIPPQHMSAFLDDIAKQFSATVQSNAERKTAPRGTKAPSNPSVQAEQTYKNSDSTSKVRLTAMKVMTLDAIVRRVRQHFNYEGGNAAVEYQESEFSRQKHSEAVQEQYRKVVNDLQSLSAEDAKAVSELWMDADHHDVNLGGSNKHLGENKFKSLQAKKALPDLEDRYANLSPKAREFFDSATAQFKKTHKEFVNELARNVLRALAPELQGKQFDYLLDKVVNGKLTSADADLVGNTALFDQLKNAANLRYKDGTYFPHERFGDRVVTTLDEVTAPDITEVTLKGKSGGTAPVKSSVEGNAVRFEVNGDVRGARTALMRQVRDWAKDQKLQVQQITTRYRDTVSGDLVSKGEQRVDRDYHTVYEVKLQNEGMHTFESDREAKRFSDQYRKSNPSSKVSNPMIKQEAGSKSDMNGQTLAAVVKHIDSQLGDHNITPGQHKLLKTVLHDAFTAQTQGNRARAKFMKRKNVAGYSDDLARVVLNYGRKAGNYIAELKTAPESAAAWDRMVKIAKESPGTGNESMISEAMSAMEHQSNKYNDLNNQYLTPVSQAWRDLKTISFAKMLADVSNVAINLTQGKDTWATLQSRYGKIDASVAMTSAYYRMGVLGTMGRGVANTGIGAFDTGKAVIDFATSAVTMGKKGTHLAKVGIDGFDPLKQVRKNLGSKYTELFDYLEAHNDIGSGSGVEVDAALERGRGAWGKLVGSMSDASRQLTSAAEIVNRTSAAVAAFDLALKRGKSKDAALMEAVDTLRETQGRYDSANKARWMTAPIIKDTYAPFKSYAQLQTQWWVANLGKAMKGATPEVRAQGRSAVASKVVLDGMIAGLVGLPAVELVKVGFMAAQAAGFGSGWESVTDWFEEELAPLLGKDWSSKVVNGVLTRSMGIDVTSRMDTSSMWTGFANDASNQDATYASIGKAFAGPFVATIMDEFEGIKKIASGDPSGWEKLSPVKAVTNVVKAANNTASGKYTTSDAVKRVIGFNSERQAIISANTGRDIRKNKQSKDEQQSIINAWKNAKDRGEKMKLIPRIREYNKTAPQQKRLSPNWLEKIANKDKQKYAAVPD
jgi:hypothetical protein